MKNKQRPIDMPIMKEMCKTCPFGPKGDQELADRIRLTVLTEASQTCHTTGVMIGKEDTHLCRGARDIQLRFFHILGVIAQPTDEAWQNKWDELQCG